MPEDLFIPVEKVVTETESVGVTLKELSLLAATPTTAGVIAVVLAAKGEDKEWRTDTKPFLVRKTDNLESENSQERYAASTLQKMMFESIVPDIEPYHSMGVAGMKVWDAAKAILGQELQSNQ